MLPYTLAIQHTPTILERLLDQIPVDRFSERLAPGRFNLVEVVAHLADWEEIWLDRVIVAVEKSGSAVEGMDEGERAIQKKYAEKDIRHELAVFASRRRDTVTYFQELAPEKWDNVMVHSQIGEVSVRAQLQLMSGHDLYHIEQVSEYLTVLHELIP